MFNTAELQLSIGELFGTIAAGKTLERFAELQMLYSQLNLRSPVARNCVNDGPLERR
jgi:hypothetical protein